MAVLRLVFWGLLIGAGAIGGFYVATGEVPSNGDAGAMFDDPSREEVDGEYIQWIELRDSGVFVGTVGVGDRDVRITLPSGETHKMFRQREDVFEESAVYPYEDRGLPSGNYTVEIHSFGEVHESHTAQLNTPNGNS